MNWLPKELTVAAYLVSAMLRREACPARQPYTWSVLCPTSMIYPSGSRM